MLSSQTVANRLGLQHHPLRGCAVAPLSFGGHTTPLRALAEPLNIELLAGPGNVVFDITICVVLVEPSQPGPRHDLYELQLGLLDFRQDVAIDWLPLWASQFEHGPTGYRFALPVVEPLPGRHYMRNSHTTSTFHITDECWYEVRGSPPVRNSGTPEFPADLGVGKRGKAEHHRASDAPGVVREAHGDQHLPHHRGVLGRGECVVRHAVGKYTKCHDNVPFGSIGNFACTDQGRLNQHLSHHPVRSDKTLASRPLT